MRWEILLVLLVLGCTGAEVPVEEGFVNAKVGMDPSIPVVNGYDVGGFLRMVPIREYDPSRELVESVTYFGAEPFTYTVQKISFEPKFEEHVEVIGGREVNFFYWEEIPFVTEAAYSAAWLDGDELHTVSAKEGMDVQGLVSALLNSTESEGLGVGLEAGIVRVPSPYPEWSLYAVSALKKSSYVLSSGYYVTGDLGRIDLMVLDGDVEFVVGKIVEELEDKNGASVGSVEFYEGFYLDGEDGMYRKIYRNGDIAVVASTPYGQKDENIVVIDFLIERGGSS